MKTTKMVAPAPDIGKLDVEAGTELDIVPDTVLGAPFEDGMIEEKSVINDLVRGAANERGGVPPTRQCRSPLLVHLCKRQ
jgi:hypothetical protein